MPGTATPAGYIVHRRPAPPDATRLERFRDMMLECGTAPAIAALQIVWLTALAVIFVVFVGCLLYFWGLGDASWSDYGCTTNFSCCTCDMATGTLTYRIEDYWQERMAQAMSALFTYSVLLATPWRISILLQCFDQCNCVCRERCHRTAPRCKDLGDGVDFYGRPNEMNFFHFPWSARLAIAVLLNLNTLLQLVHQVLHFVWNDVVTYMMQPNGLISLATGPAAGVLTGAPVALIQLRQEYRLHVLGPGRFPPTPLNTVGELWTGWRKGETLSSMWQQMKESDRMRRKSARVPSTSTRGSSGRGSGGSGSGGSAGGGQSSSAEPAAVELTSPHAGIDASALRATAPVKMRTLGRASSKNKSSKNSMVLQSSISEESSSGVAGGSFRSISVSGTV